MLTEKDIKKELYDYNYIVGCIDEANKELEINKDAIEACRQLSALSYKEVNSSTNRISDTVFVTVERIEKLEDSIKYWNVRLDSLNTRRIRIISWLDNLESKEREIITYRFIKKMQWHVIGKASNYTERQCRRISKSALQKIMLSESCPRMSDNL